MSRKQPLHKRIIGSRRNRLFASLALALITFILTRNHAEAVISFLLVWVAFAVSNLALSWYVILSIHPREVKIVAGEEDWGNKLIFLFVVFAAFISLFAIIFLLQSIPKGSTHGLSEHILLAIAAVASSWTLVHTVFTLRYAHLFYERESRRITEKELIAGLSFPNEETPDYIDFAYFSFVLGMTFQVSDVTINSRRIRRLALFHSVLAFVYNTVIVALSINIISGMISK